MNAIWITVSLISCILLLINSPESILPAFLTGAENGVKLCVTLLPVYIVWSGIISIMEESGLANKVSKLLSPITRRLFKGESEQTQKYITLNFSANLLGAGGAGTPLGIKAIRSMQGDSEKITPHSVLFTIINTTSIQLIPSTIISLLAQNGANEPYGIILPTLIVSTISTVLAVLLYQIFVKK